MYVQCTCTHKCASYCGVLQAKAPGSSVIVVGTHLDTVPRPDREEKMRKWIEMIHLYKNRRAHSHLYPNIMEACFVGLPRKGKQVRVHGPDGLADCIFDVAMKMNTHKGTCTCMWHVYYDLHCISGAYEWLIFSCLYTCRCMYMYLQCHVHVHVHVHVHIHDKNQGITTPLKQIGLVVWEKLPIMQDAFQPMPGLDYQLCWSDRERTYYIYWCLA